MAEKTTPATIEKQAPATREETREEERYLSPPVDIFETDQGLTVVADMPGVSKEALDVRVDNGVLTIRGNTEHVAPGDETYSEYALRSFFRQFELNDEVDQEGIGAKLHHGVLTLQLPKAEKAKPRQIPVNVG